MLNGHNGYREATVSSEGGTAPGGNSSWRIAAERGRSCREAVGNRPVRVRTEPPQPLRFLPPALLDQQPGQQPGSISVVGVGPGPHHLDGPVRVAAVGQQIGQFQDGTPFAGVGAGLEIVQVAAVSQQTGQPRGGSFVPGVGQPTAVASSPDYDQ